MSDEPHLIKLVRDRIGPLSGAGGLTTYAKIPEEIVIPLLRRKMVEEAIEYLVEPSLSEIGDTYEVLRCIASREWGGLSTIAVTENISLYERGISSRALVDSSVTYLDEPTWGNFVVVYVNLIRISNTEYGGLEAVISEAERKRIERGGFDDGIGMFTTTLMPNHK